VSASIQVLYALPGQQVIVEVPLESGLTALEAVERSGLMNRYPEIGDQRLVLGVWGAEVDPAHVLSDGDRVEISRPLQADPRAMRRDLLAEGRVMGGEKIDRSGQDDGASSRSRSMRVTRSSSK
jgi:putative ubiquitin-RnfH superfamily antitoxin RatB of RatAB toxin-antitoxin module